MQNLPLLRQLCGLERIILLNESMSGSVVSQAHSDMRCECECWCVLVMGQKKNRTKDKLGSKDNNSSRQKRNNNTVNKRIATMLHG